MSKHTEISHVCAFCGEINIIKFFHWQGNNVIFRDRCLNCQKVILKGIDHE